MSVKENNNKSIKKRLSLKSNIIINNYTRCQDEELPGQEAVTKTH